MRRWPLSWIKSALNEAHEIHQAYTRISRIDDLTISEGIGTGTINKDSKGDDSVSTDPFVRERERLVRITDPVRWELERRVRDLRAAQGLDDQLDAMPVTEINWDLVEDDDGCIGSAEEAGEDGAGSEPA